MNKAHDSLVKLMALKKEAWVRNVMNKLGLTKEEAEAKYLKIRPFMPKRSGEPVCNIKP